MIAYVESNFVLERALLQEQHEACDQIIALAEKGHFQLVLPAFSLAEPYHTLGRRFQQRRVLSESLSNELQQLSRSVNLADEVETLRDVTGLLIRSGEDESNGLRDALLRLIHAARLIPLDRATMIRSWEIANDHSLSSPDAIVLSSVLNDLDLLQPDDAVFLNRNAKDFDDPDIVAQLSGKNCRLIPSFVDGLSFIKSRIGDPGK